MGYAWIVTKDHLEAAEGYDDPTVSKYATVEVIGPSEATEDQIRRLRAGEGVAFRMYDDDGLIYYSGKFLGADNGPLEHKYDPPCVSSGLDDDAFGPLDDYGTPNAGAVTIKFRCSDGTWAVL